MSDFLEHLRHVALTECDLTALIDSERYDRLEAYDRPDMDWSFVPSDPIAADVPLIDF